MVKGHYNSIVLCVVKDHYHSIVMTLSGITRIIIGKILSIANSLRVLELKHNWTKLNITSLKL